MTLIRSTLGTNKMFFIRGLDKQVLWESTGAFFPRDNSLVSDRKSHSLNLWPWQLLTVGQLPAFVATSGTWHRGYLGLFEVCQAEGRGFESRS